MLLPLLAFFDSLIAIAVAAAGVVAAHFGLSTAVLGFTMFSIGCAFGLLAILFSIISLLLMLLLPSRRSKLSLAALAGVFGLIVILPMAITLITHPYPAINDVTTDTKDPPEFAYAPNLPANRGRDMKYDAAVNARIQEAFPAYQDLGPLKLDMPPADAYKKAEIIAGEITDWQITSNDPQQLTLEGVATSALFRFKNDFVIQVRPAAGGGSLIEMRSKSRIGKADLGTDYDFGANYNRIKSFFHLMQGPPRGVASMN